MRVIVSAEGEGLGAAPCSTFGRSPYLVVIDTDTGMVTSLPNPGREAAHGAGIEAARFVVAQGAAALCSGAVGPNAYDVCEAADIEMFVSVGDTVGDVLSNHTHGSLQSLEKGRARHAGSGQ